LRVKNRQEKGKKSRGGNSHSCVGKTNKAFFGGRHWFQGSCGLQRQGSAERRKFENPKKVRPLAVKHESTGWGGTVRPKRHFFEASPVEKKQGGWGVQETHPKKRPNPEKREQKTSLAPADSSSSKEQKKKTAEREGVRRGFRVKKKELLRPRRRSRFLALSPTRKLP